MRRKLVRARIGFLFVSCSSRPEFTGYAKNLLPPPLRRAEGSALRTAAAAA